MRLSSLFQPRLGPDPTEFASGGGGDPVSQAADPVLDPNAGETTAPAAPDSARPDFNGPGASDPLSGGAPAGGSAPIPADPNQRAGHPAQAAQTAAGWQSIRDAATAQGFRFGPEITDDRAALQFLLQQAGRARQTDVHAQLGRQLAPRAGEILGYLQGQKPAAAPAAAKPWEAPEFDERWAALVDRDPASGLFVGKPGVPAEIVDKVNAYVTWKTNFDRNPGQVLNGMVEERARQIARDTFAEQFAEQQQEATVRQILGENSQWLYQRDAAGNMLRSYEGQPITTPVGARYITHLQSLVRAGVTDPRQQDAMAKQLVRGEWAIAAQQAASGQQTAAGSPQTQQAMGQPNINPLAAQPPVQRRRNPSAPPEPATGKSLAEMLREDLAAEGVTDADVFNSVGA